MRTKEELRDLIARRLEANIFKGSTFADLVSAISSATPPQKQHLVDLLISGKAEKAGELLEKALKTHANDNAITQADSFLVDDSLSLAELDKII
jgi:hypothetical protein